MKKFLAVALFLAAGAAQAVCVSMNWGAPGWNINSTSYAAGYFCYSTDTNADGQITMAELTSGFFQTYVPTIGTTNYSLANLQGVGYTISTQTVNYISWSLGSVTANYDINDGKITVFDGTFGDQKFTAPGIRVSP